MTPQEQHDFLMNNGHSERKSEICDAYGHPVYVPVVRPVITLRRPARFEPEAR